MEKLKEIGNLVTAITITTRACKAALSGVKAYRRHPARLVYSLSELLTETATLHNQAAQLDTLVSDLHAACIPCPASNGTPAELAGIPRIDSNKGDSHGS